MKCPGNCYSAVIGLLTKLALNIIEFILIYVVSLVGSLIKSYLKWALVVIRAGRCIIPKVLHYCTLYSLAERCPFHFWETNQYAKSEIILTIMLLAIFASTKSCKKAGKWLKTLADGYSSESTQWELSNGYKHDMV